MESTIVEIRAGEGGADAKLLVDEQLKIYARFAKRAGFATFAIVHTLSSFTIVYGRRRTVLMILVGYLVGMAVRFSAGSIGHVDGNELTVIGFIIPGLIAIWLDRQGIVETLAALVTASVVVRLILVIIVGPELRG